MKRFSLLVAIFLSFLAADPAGAWFWEKTEVKSPGISQEVRPEPGPKAEEKGILDRIRDYFKATGKEVKQSAKEAPGEFKQGARETGRSLKQSGREIKQEAKQVPGELKEGAKAVGEGFKETGKELKQGAKQFPGKAKEGAIEVGQGFKQLGRDIKGDTKKAIEN